MCQGLARPLASDLGFMTPHGPCALASELRQALLCLGQPGTGCAYVWQWRASIYSSSLWLRQVTYLISSWQRHTQWQLSAAYFLVFSQLEIYPYMEVCPGMVGFLMRKMSLFAWLRGAMIIPLGDLPVWSLSAKSLEIASRGSGA